jgi:hypothetical protein
VPFWDLRRLGRGILVLAVDPEDTESSVQARFVAWLDERYYLFTLKGVEYELYRIPRDFWHPHKEQPAPSGVWEVRRDSSIVTQFPETGAGTVSAAINEFVRELTSRPFECLGGPLDGERVGERGAEFEAFWEWDEHLDEDNARRVRRAHRGRYRRTNEAYEWEGE